MTQKTNYCIKSKSQPHGNIPFILHNSEPLRCMIDVYQHYHLKKQN